ncbi:hypothetical protein SAMN04488063_0751 [Halopelagius inordinatus]|uniref:BZIP transcription factor n=1 Tax=Halopelagius inordinatus TaxID=553467 RepID=A0A1I2MHA1_9EURY|nr:hypothetical protein [Halopelagius inordinatus]SFF90905.1 hypothetical protein SAMN04488063_0751 [Halopelagius inordinatus]
MSNRVEELESKVAELQAAVNGLTEELVETKERVRLLEDQVEVDLSTGTRPVGHESPSEETADPEPTAASDSQSEPQTERKVKPGESPAQTESRSETSDNPGTDADLIDADAEAFGTDDTADTAADDGDKSEEGESEDEADTTDDSDIIVA